MSSIGLPATSSRDSQSVQLAKRLELWRACASLERQNAAGRWNAPPCEISVVESLDVGESFANKQTTWVRLFLSNAA